MHRESCSKFSVTRSRRALQVDFNYFGNFSPSLIVYGAVGRPHFNCESCRRTLPWVFSLLLHPPQPAPTHQPIQHDDAVSLGTITCCISGLYDNFGFTRGVADRIFSTSRRPQQGMVGCLLSSPSLLLSVFYSLFNPTPLINNITDDSGVVYKLFNYTRSRMWEWLVYLPMF